MSTLMEEGELPEEGEITEDEEEQDSQNLTTTTEDSKSKATEKKELDVFVSKKSNIFLYADDCFPLERSTERSEFPSIISDFALVSTGVSTPQPKTSKYRDYDGKNTRHGDATQNAMMTSWMSGIPRRSREAPAGVGSTTPDGKRPTLLKKENESPSANSGHSPKTSSDMATTTRGTNMDSMDRDFRRLSSAEQEVIGEKEDGEADPFGENDEDNDFRQVCQVGSEQKRRHSAGHSDETTPYTKRAKPSSMKDPFSDEHNEESPNTSNFDENNGNFYRRNHSTRTPAPHWASHTMCKFFREGYCRDGDNCAFSHSAVDSNRRPELCKYYSQGFCKRGMNCAHLHGEYPCKAFHKGECTNDPCQFSHRPLDQFTRPIYNQMLQDEELTSNISLPSHPAKRKVLLPQGPETPDGAEQPDGSPPSSEAANISGINTNTGSVPVVTTTPLRPPSMTQQQMKQRAAEDKALAAAGTFGFFNPITPVTKPVVIPPPTSFIPPTSIHASSTESPLAQKPLGVFSTPATSINGIAGRTPIQSTAGQTHGFYNPPSRVTNMPPPALLSVPPPLASNPASTIGSTLPPVVSSFAQPPATTSFFNPPAIVSTPVQPSLPTTSHGPADTSSFINTSSAVSVPPPVTNAFSALAAKEDETVEKPLSGMFSGGFFSSSSSQVNNNTAKNDTGCSSGIAMGGGDGGGFNISAMLEKITQQATATPAAMSALPSLNSLIASTTQVNKWEDESPASPTNTTSESTGTVKMIPVIREWKLYKVDMDKENEDEINVDLKWIGQISTGSYKNDPRLKKLAEKQFDLVTKTLEKQSNSVSIKPEPSTSTSSSGSASPPKKNVAEVARPSDPRVKPIDPRKRSTSNSQSSLEPTGLYGDVYNTTAPASLPMTSGYEEALPTLARLSTSLGANEIQEPVNAAAGPRKLPDDIFQSMVQQQLKLVNQMQQQQLRPNNPGDDDVDHRTPLDALLCPTFLPFLTFPPPPIGSAPFLAKANPPPRGATGPEAGAVHVADGGAFGAVFGEPSFGQGEGFDQRYNRGNGRRDTQSRFGNKARSNDNQNGHRWNQQREQFFGGKNVPKRPPNNNSNENAPAAQRNPAPADENVTQQQQPAAVATPLPQQQQPISLREKRKNNEYESPLARLSTSRF